MNQNISKILIAAVFAITVMAQAKAARRPKRS
jgi:hypothetical protein